jgi:hypothetical protein
LGWAFISLTNEPFSAAFRFQSARERNVGLTFRDSCLSCILQGAIKTNLVEIVPDHHQIDIARAVRAFGYRPVDERAIDLVSERLQ